MKTLKEIFEASILDIEGTLADGDKFEKALLALKELYDVCSNKGIAFEETNKVTWRYYITSAELLEILGIKPKKDGKICIEISKQKSLYNWFILFAEADFKIPMWRRGSMNVKFSEAKDFKALMKKLTNDRVFADIDTFKKSFKI